MTGIELIAAERDRQIEREGWTPEHDDDHFHGELAMAAACYALPVESPERQDAYAWGTPPTNWPWSRKWWKPAPLITLDGPNTADRIRELAKAGALVAAEIDRLLRRGS